MDLIPESIKGDNTQALDQTFLDRLVNLGVERLSIDLLHENDLTKLSLWLEQFGIPLELLPDDIDHFILRDLLPLTFKIFNLSGTDTSIRLLAQALGAKEITINKGCFNLNYTPHARHDGLFRYDQGKEYQSFAVDIDVYGMMSENEHNSFDKVFRKLFRLFQPLHLHLNEIWHQEKLLATENSDYIVTENNLLINLEK